MLHIIRKDETLMEIAELYGVSTDAVLSANAADRLVMLTENSCVCVPTQSPVMFTQAETTLSQLEEKRKLPQNTLLELNGGEELSLPKNVRVQLPKRTRRLEAAAIYALNNAEGAFVELDRCRAHIDLAYIAAYSAADGKLNLPYDYPAINACRLSGITPMFYISDTAPYGEAELLGQLKNDLSFKDYAGGLFELKNDEDLAAMQIIAPEMWKLDMRLSISGEAAMLAKITASALYEHIYYRPERNIFDFESFQKTIETLLERFSPDKLGFNYIARAADIDRDNSHIVYLRPSELPKLASRHNIESVSFDARSCLCFFKYEEYGGVHNVIYEDLRSFYAKAAFLAECGVNSVILGELSCASAGLSDVLMLL